ncbi:uncharacterized protein TNCV_1521631 [Trichonephila clavipes]|nr:uncharacterized protein TNCV_1521631 [Trichonephila clavipes]
MKLSHRLIVIATVVLSVFFIICVIENVLKGSDLTEGEDSVHGRQHFIFHRRFLNREETSKISAEAPNNPMNVIPLPPKNANKKNVTKKTTVSTTKEPRDEFPDLFKYSTLSPNFRQYMEWPPYFRLPKYNPTLADVLKVKVNPLRYDFDGHNSTVAKVTKFVIDDSQVELSDQVLIYCRGPPTLGLGSRELIHRSNGTGPAKEY